MERERERDAWMLHWILAGLVGGKAPTPNQILGKEAPPMPDDPYGEVLKLIDPQAAREREWAKIHGIDTNEN